MGNINQIKILIYALLFTDKFIVQKIFQVYLAYEIERQKYALLELESIYSFTQLFISIYLVLYHYASIESITRNFMP